MTPPPASTGTVRRVDHVMGMPVSLALRGRHAGDAQGEAAWAAAMQLLRDADRVFSTYRADSVVSRLGRGDVTLADCPPEVAEVLALGEAAERESGGAFAIRRRTDTGALVLDPSGVVKGWAVQRAVAPLQALAGTDFCLSAGGDMVCHTAGAAAGPDAAGPDAAVPWRIGIEHPLRPDRLVAVVPVRSGAVATSGTAHRGQHVVDARTGRPPIGVASVTVLAPTLTVADIDATAAFALGERAADWLATRPGRTGLVVWADGSTTLVDARVDASRGASQQPVGAATTIRCA